LYRTPHNVERNHGVDEVAEAGDEADKSREAIAESAGEDEGVVHPASQCLDVGDSWIDDLRVEDLVVLLRLAVGNDGPGHTRV